MMAASQRNCYLLVVGDGPEREIYEALVPPDFLERVIFLGQRTDVSELLCSTDVFIQYSTSEGLSLSILEAMAHGVACIVSDVGGNSELIQSGQSGFLVDPNNLDLLESRLREVISNAGLRKYIAEGARSRAGEFFELDSCLNAYMMVYSRRLQHG